MGSRVYFLAFCVTLFVSRLAYGQSDSVPALLSLEVGLSGQFHLVGFTIPNLQGATETFGRLEKSYGGLGLTPTVLLKPNQSFLLQYAPTLRFSYYRPAENISKTIRKFYHDHHLTIFQSLRKAGYIGVGYSMFSVGRELNGDIVRVFNNGTVQIDSNLDLTFSAWHASYRDQFKDGRLSFEIRVAIAPPGNISFLGYENGAVIPFVGFKYVLP